jgi:type 1 glutamine amidotransferase
VVNGDTLRANYEHGVTIPVKVIYIQLGHGPSAYSNPNYRKLIQQAIEWSARTNLSRAGSL